LGKHGRTKSAPPGRRRTSSTTKVPPAYGIPAVSLLRQETRLLLEEGRRTRLKTHELREELHNIYNDFLAVRQDLERNGVGPFKRIESHDAAASLVVPGQEGASVGPTAMDLMEEERRHIARELHDDLNQHVALLRLKISSLQSAISGTPGALEAERRLLASGLEELATKISRLSRRLHPSILTDLGLEAALRSCVRDFAQYTNIKVAFRSTNIPEDLSEQVGIHLYRILQEALHNILKHAKADRASVALSGIARGAVRLEVQDYGDGLSEDHAKKRGLGLINMKERARLLHGTFSMKSRPGKGLRITVEVPADARPEQRSIPSSN